MSDKHNSPEKAGLLEDGCKIIQITDEEIDQAILLTRGNRFKDKKQPSNGKEKKPSD